MGRKDWVVQENRKDFKLYRKKGTDAQISYSDNDPPAPSHQIVVTGAGSENINRSFKTKSKALRAMKTYMGSH